ncbi:alpha/beta fold hydrolase [Nitrosopumilus sp.]|uniref:alpha/beta fold hydrolase n=1 Tax=Nitrosopumilus sp. TaxID=2024843 RepID=UPI003B59894C
MKTKRILKYFGISIVILVGGFLAAGQIAYHSVPMMEPPGKIYSVEGTDMHLYCTGPENDSAPIIIIITGAGTQSPLYYNLQANLSETVRTCSYDRAGTGWSESNGNPADANNMSDELYRLLQIAKIDGPIILAGHSLGGIVSLIYSAEHEEQVAGIAFIDSSHYNQYDYFGKEFSDAVYKQNDDLLSSFWLIELVSKLGIVSLTSLISEDSESESDMNIQGMYAYFDRWTPLYATMKSEIVSLQTSFEQGKEAHYFREDLPIISLSASDHDASFFPKTGPSEQEIRDAIKSFHKDLASLSSDGRHVVVEGTDHMSIIQNEKTAEHILSLIPLIEEK